MKKSTRNRYVLFGALGLGALYLWKHHSSQPAPAPAPPVNRSVPAAITAMGGAVLDIFSPQSLAPPQSVR